MATLSTQQRSTPALQYLSRTVSTKLQPLSAPASSGMRGRVDIADLTQNNINQLRKLNSALFPVRFGEKWYKDVLEKDLRNVCKYALFNDIPVANVCCRFEHGSSASGPVKVYIMTLGCLAPYRRIGIATLLLDHILEVAGPGQTVLLHDKHASTTHAAVPGKATMANAKDAKKVEPKVTEHTVESVYLHVQTSNEEAKAFYEKRGFVVASRIEEYYKVGIEPRSAWVLEKRGA